MRGGNRRPQPPGTGRRSLRGEVRARKVASGAGSHAPTCSPARPDPKARLAWAWVGIEARPGEGSRSTRLVPPAVRRSGVPDEEVGVQEEEEEAETAAAPEPRRGEASQPAAAAHRKPWAPRSRPEGAREQPRHPGRRGRARRRRRPGRVGATPPGSGFGLDRGPLQEARSAPRLGCESPSQRTPHTKKRVEAGQEWEWGGNLRRFSLSR